MPSLTPDAPHRLSVFLQEQSAQRGFNRVVVGLSGGLDSAVVALLCHRVFKQNCHALIMPALTSSPQSQDHALLLCERFNISFSLAPIQAYHQLFNQDHPQASLTRQGNFCARMRMICLYDHSLTHQALVVGTSNKSERMLGYGTIFGDLACAINPIGDLFKTQVYELARMLDVPLEILEKKPSADFYVGQSDEADLGFSYVQIDPLLFEISQRWAHTKQIDCALLVQLGYDPLLVKKIVGRVQQNAFKLEPPLICKLS
ncbi:NAD+ synthase [Helicobacter mehlei]|uniref:NH(3)-dependent NAD(+) synthetase n=1 Tax=Helicobacter mehlei TaxID=2316080 RepID=A0A553V1Y7_9HELI|nr:NAD+ synthase [Helicobacter mehlei]TSA86241.1 NAD+ synthase [Helicobacter mehlei]